jgi:hypothetical protein
MTAVPVYSRNQLTKMVPSSLMEVKHYAMHINRYVAFTYWMTRKTTIQTKGRQELEMRQEWPISRF